MKQRRANRVLRVVLSTTSLVLPALTLIPLGSLWLWEHGYLIHWAVAAFGLVALGVFLQWLVLRNAAPVEAQDSPSTIPTENWNEREREAWTSVEAYAAALKPGSVIGEDGLKEVALATIRLVASKLHPNDPNPLWNFTVPDALLLAERVSARLRPVVVENIPLGDQLTVRQVLRLYEWRGAVDWAERAYDIWRIVRLLNPASALAHEARERMTKNLYSNLRDEFTVRLAQGYVREVARAAIDLYSGRLGGGYHTNATPPMPATPAMNETMPSPTPGFSWKRLGRQAGSVGKLAAKSILRRK